MQWWTMAEFDVNIALNFSKKKQRYHQNSQGNSREREIDYDEYIIVVFSH